MIIGNVLIDPPIILAPMAGVSDKSFRLLCREQGAAMACTEMISAKAVVYGNKKTVFLAESFPGEKPLSLQLFGSDPEIMAEAAAMIEDWDFDILDINMGCPVPKIVKNGEGSALMLKPGLCGDIVKAVSTVSSRPVTVKMRSGFDEQSKNAVEVAKSVEEAGASAICVHGRTRAMFYSGKADRYIIRQVKEAVSIPVVGNGDIFSAADALSMMQDTGCDGIMVGRGARGNPWIFRDINEALERGNDNFDQLVPADQVPDNEQLREMILRHARLAIEDKGEYIAIREMRKHVSWYTFGRRGCASLRREMNHVSSYEELERLMGRLRSDKSSER